MAGTADVEQPSNDGGERKRANRTSARHESGAETLPERRDGGDLHGKAVAYTGSDAEEEGVSEKERDDADVGERLRREEETRAGDDGGAGATTAGLRREYRPGPILATATVKHTVVREKTPERRPRPTPRACSRGTR